MTKLFECQLCFLALAVFSVLSAPTPKLSEGNEQSELNSVEQLMIESTRTEIETILADKSINWREQRKRIDKILDLLPPRLFAQLPLPSQLQRLPEDVLQQIKLIRVNSNLSIREKRERIRHLMENLTYEQRAALNEEPFPDRPPAGFEQVLDSETLEHLMAIHDNDTLTIAEKKNELDSIFRELPKEVAARLPLPILMRQLPKDIQDRIHAVLYDFQRSWDERFRLTRKFVRTLPKQYRRLIRPVKVFAVFDPVGRKYAPQSSERTTEVVTQSPDIALPTIPIVEDVKPAVLSSLGFTVSPIIQGRVSGVLP
ncbi:hypothetical protein M3Y94_01230100 [Aphelenchoides besseyi]|nr:hypothetical protein M3Y94_01230100 [Aphelenchoides besseyi]KAI6216282.1 hypothetical protein M3Y95_01288300 [Aphelenchoides besseyi]